MNRYNDEPGEHSQNPYTDVTWLPATEYDFQGEPVGEVVSYGVDSFINGFEYKRKKEDVIGVIALNAADVRSLYVALESKKANLVPALAYLELDNSYIGTLPSGINFGRIPSRPNDFLVGCKLSSRNRFVPGFYLPGERFYHPANSQPFGVFTLDEMKAQLRGVPFVRL